MPNQAHSLHFNHSKFDIDRLYLLLAAKEKTRQPQLFILLKKTFCKTRHRKYRKDNA